MMRKIQLSVLAGILLPAVSLVALATAAGAQSASSQSQLMPSGQLITPLAPAGARFPRLNPGLKDFPGYTVGRVTKTAVLFNQILWKVPTSGASYPAARSGKDLSRNRERRCWRSPARAFFISCTE